MSTTNKILAIERADFNSNTLTGGFDVLYTSLPEPLAILRIVNESNRDITISYDGSTNHDLVPSSNTLQLYLQASNRPRSHVAQLPKGSTIYVKGTAGGTGYIYVAGYYNV